MTPGSSGELTGELSQALNAWRRTRDGFLVVMVQVHPSERRGSWGDMATRAGLQLELARRLGRVTSVDDKLFVLDQGVAVVVCRHVVRSEEARRIAERFTREASNPSWDDSSLPIHVSSGAILATAKHASSEALLADAEKAMLRAATGIGTQLVFIDDSQWPDLVAGFSTLDAPREHTASGFHLNYQPIVEASNDSTWGMEALLRWEGAAPARRSALDLVHVAEQTDWMEPLGRWVAQEATSQAQQWAQAAATDLIVFVNVSSTQLSSPRFTGDIDETLRISGLASTRLGLDVTTSALGDDQALRNLHTLSGRGVTVALDDFEMEVAAMQSLVGMPLDLVKLDVSFMEALAAPSASSLLTGIVSSAHQLGYSVTAKNVESQSQLEMAIGAGCDYIQGLFISPPLLAAELDEFTATRNNGTS